MALQIFGTLSPISFEHEGKFSPRQIQSSVIPPFAKAPVEAFSGERGFNLFTEREIEPRTIEGVKTEDLPHEERATERTTEFAKFVGKRLGVSKFLGLSPIKIDHIVRGMFGEVGTIITEPSKFLKHGKRRFFGDFGNAEINKQFKLLDEAKQRGAMKKLAVNREVAEFFEKNKDLSNEEIVENFKDRPALLKKVEDEIKNRAKSLNSFERSLKMAGVGDETRAFAMYLILKHNSAADGAKKLERWSVAGKTDKRSSKPIMNQEVLKQLVGMVESDEELNEKIGDATRGFVDTRFTAEQAVLEEQKLGAQSLEDTATRRVEEIRGLMETDRAGANEILLDLKKNNRRVFDLVKKKFKEAKKPELTERDALIHKMGVSNGVRADYIVDRIADMSNEEAVAFITDLKAKGLYSKRVRKQVLDLRKKRRSTEKGKKTRLLKRQSQKQREDAELEAQFNQGGAQ
jgi:hypothetical protein